MATKEVLWATLPLKGVWYMKDNHGVKDTINFGKMGKEVRLVLQRDGSNRHDSKAIKVNDQYGCQIGWVPKEQNQHLSMLMDEMGHKFVACVPAGNAYAWSGLTSIKMDIYLVKEDYTVEPINHQKLSTTTMLAQNGLSKDDMQQVADKLNTKRLAQQAQFASMAQARDAMMAEIEKRDAIDNELASKCTVESWVKITTVSPAVTKPKMDDFL